MGEQPPAGDSGHELGAPETPVSPPVPQPAPPPAPAASAFSRLPPPPPPGPFAASQSGPGGPAGQWPAPVQGPRKRLSTPVIVLIAIVAVVAVVAGALELGRIARPPKIAIALPSTFEGHDRLNDAASIKAASGIKASAADHGLFADASYYGVEGSASLYLSASQRWTRIPPTQLVNDILTKDQTYVSSANNGDAIDMSGETQTQSGDAAFACAPVTGKYEGWMCVWADTSAWGHVRLYGSSTDPLPVVMSARSAIENPAAVATSV